jgi:hypothetical protein
VVERLRVFRHVGFFCGFAFASAAVMLSGVAVTPRRRPRLLVPGRATAGTHQPNGDRSGTAPDAYEENTVDAEFEVK